MPAVEDVRLILERTFGMPVAESDAQFVLDRLNELASKEAAQQITPADSDPRDGVFLEPKGSHESNPFAAQDKP